MKPTGRSPDREPAVGDHGHGDRQPRGVGALEDVSAGIGATARET